MTEQARDEQHNPVLPKLKAFFKGYTTRIVYSIVKHVTCISQAELPIDMCSQVDICLETQCNMHQLNSLHPLLQIYIVPIYDHARSTVYYF